MPYWNTRKEMWWTHAEVFFIGNLQYGEYIKLWGSPLPPQHLLWCELLGWLTGTRQKPDTISGFKNVESIWCFRAWPTLLVPQGHRKPWLSWWTRHILSKSPSSFAKGCRIKYPWSLGEELWKEVFENHNVSVQFEFSIPPIVESELKCVHTCAHL